MARKTKPIQATVTTVTESKPVDVEEIATKVAKAVAKEMAAELSEVLKNLPRGGYIPSGSGYNPSYEPEIQIDERIIPMSVKAEAIDTNLTAMAKEEVKVDKDLSKSKSKLAGLLKKKKKEE